MKEDSKCAPHLEYDNVSCITPDNLKFILNLVNKKKNYSDKKKYDKKELVNKLNEKFNKSCSDQICWIDKLIENEDDELVKEKLNNIIKDSFRPEGPNRGNQWLSTTDIDEVIKQYQEVYKDFIYLGTVPTDFEKLPLGISDIDFDKLKKDNINKIAMVINLDKHDQSGSHWVALYANLKDNKIYFFDSFGKPPNKEIRNFNKKILQFLYKNKYNEDINSTNIKKAKNYNTIIKNLIKNFDIRYNQIQHQQENSECGVYSTNFILRLLKGETFDDITKNITDDNEINKCRDVYFREKK